MDKFFNGHPFNVNTSIIYDLKAIAHKTFFFFLCDLWIDCLLLCFELIHVVPFYVSVAFFNSSVWACHHVSCCLLALVGVSFYNKFRIQIFTRLLVWFVMIRVIIKVMPIGISMWVILCPTHFATLIWCENIGLVEFFWHSCF